MVEIATCTGTGAGGARNIIGTKHPLASPDAAMKRFGLSGCTLETFLLANHLMTGIGYGKVSHQFISTRHVGLTLERRFVLVVHTVKSVPCGRTAV
jgi:hypothetical protein